MSFAAVPSSRGVLADLVPATWTRNAALVAGGAAVTGAAAQVSVHVPALTPVPFTLQTLAVLMVGSVLGSARGVLSMLLYVAAGSVGVPWFADAEHGWAYAPSFGYVLGFLLAAAVVGELARRGNDRVVMSSVGLMLVGDAVILAVGTTWLAADLHVSAAKAISLGVTPFLLAEIAKVAVAAVTLPLAWRAVRR